MAQLPLEQKLGVSKAALSRKIRKVKRHHPEKSNRQAVGMAAGILRGNR